MDQHVAERLPFICESLGISGDEVEMIDNVPFVLSLSSSPNFLQQPVWQRNLKID